MGMKTYLKTQKIEQILKIWQASGKFGLIVYCGRYFFHIFLSKRPVVVLGKTSVCENFVTTSVGGEEIKKFAKLPENFRDGWAWKVNMLIFRPNQLKISEIVKNGNYICLNLEKNLKQITYSNENPF